MPETLIRLAKYIPDIYAYRRRRTREVMVGNVGNPPPVLARRNPAGAIVPKPAPVGSRSRE